MADDKGLNDKPSLSLLDKIKLLLGAKSVASQITDKLPESASGTSVWTKLDGTKSITGLLMIVAYYALPRFGVKVPDIFLKIGITWAGVGFLHKFDKATNILTAVATALNDANKTINGDNKNK